MIYIFLNIIKSIKLAIRRCQFARPGEGVTKISRRITNWRGQKCLKMDHVINRDN